MAKNSKEPDTSPASPFLWVIRIGVFISLIFVFLVSIELLGYAFSHLSQELTQQILLTTLNPFVGLFIGILATVIFQSSSTTTSIAVAMVASGLIDLSAAIPIIMGANIGTTVTSTIVSLNHLIRINEFKRALAASTIHDAFNILITLLLFPLEYYFDALSIASESIAHILEGVLIFGTEGQSSSSSPSAYVAVNIIDVIGSNTLIILIVAFSLLLLTIKLFSEYFKQLLIGQSRRNLSHYVFGTSGKSFLWGTASTLAVQSSSVTTSLLVPLVAHNKVSLKRALPFAVGANLGTTLTALIASVNKNEAALSLAVAHLLFNAIGFLLIMGIPKLSSLIIGASVGLAQATTKNRLIGLGYIVILFFLAPFLLISLSGKSAKEMSLDYKIISGSDTVYKRSTVTFLPNKNEAFVQSYFNIKLSGIKIDSDSVSTGKIEWNSSILKENNEVFPIYLRDTCVQNNSEIRCYEILKKSELAEILQSDTIIAMTTHSKNGQLLNTYKLDLTNRIFIERKQYEKNNGLVYSEKLIGFRNEED